jgi:hypothetical protein
VYEHIEAAKVSNYVFDTFTASVRISDVCFERARCRAMSLDSRKKILWYRPGPSGNDGDVSAFPCKSERSGGPNTAGTPGDKTNLSWQIHASPSSNGSY